MSFCFSCCSPLTDSSCTTCKTKLIKNLSEIKEREGIDEKDDKILTIYVELENEIEGSEVIAKEMNENNFSFKKMISYSSKVNDWRKILKIIRKKLKMETLSSLTFLICNKLGKIVKNDQDWKKFDSENERELYLWKQRLLKGAVDSFILSRDNGNLEKIEKKTDGNFSVVHKCVVSIKKK